MNSQVLTYPRHKPAPPVASSLRRATHWNTAPTHTNESDRIFPLTTHHDRRTQPSAGGTEARAIHGWWWLRQTVGREQAISSHTMAQPPQRSRPVVVRGRIRDEFQCPITAQILRCVPWWLGGGEDISGGGAGLCASSACGFTDHLSPPAI